LTVSIRKALPEEYDEVSALTVEAYEEYAAPMGDEWEHYRADLADVARRAERGDILVAESDGELVGAVSYYPAGRVSPQNDWWWPEDFAYFRAIAVRPSQRGRGIGRALTLACIDRARAERAAGIALNTTSWMPVAQGMYERMGFRLERQSEYPGICVFSYVMSLNGT
jgi:ribosomal protein S18 acetylase RimI-like enzyme